MKDRSKIREKIFYAGVIWLMLVVVGVLLLAFGSVIWMLYMKHIVAGIIATITLISVICIIVGSEYDDY